MLKNTNKKIVLITLLVFLTNLVILPVNADDVQVLENEIADQKAKIKALENRLSDYRDKIKVKEQQSVTLKNQIGLFENQIEKTEIAIEINQGKINQTGLEIKKTEKEIIGKEEKIAKHKEQLSELIRRINKNDGLGYLEIFLLNSNLSDFFDEIESLSAVQNDLQITLNNIQTAKQQLAGYQTELELKKKGLETLKRQLNEEQSRLSDNKQDKEILLSQTKNSERTFKNLLAAAQREFSQANADIQTLEKKVREALERKKQLGGSLDDNPATLSWPSNGRQIVAYFHDPDYPYRKWIGEHPAVDIRTLINGVPSNGVAIHAAASGYVARAKNGGANGYSYVLLVHNGGISTVYGHLSRFDVQEDTYVVRGQQIGLSGGMPGTPGAGRFSSGPHLHFEVRLNGIPVNPLNYLP